MIDPFDLRGPEFLAFYFLLSSVGALVVYVFWWCIGTKRYKGLPLTDPYRIGYLRAGAEEAIKVAAASLSHRGLLDVKGDMLITQSKSAVVTNELERVLLKDCVSGRSAQTLTHTANEEAAKSLYHHGLITAGLILSDRQRAAMIFCKVLVIGLLMLVAISKIVIAFNRGHHNVLFLVLLSLGAALGIGCIENWQSPAGKQQLSDLKTLFKKLKKKAFVFVAANKKGTSSEADFSLLAAIYGMSVLSSSLYPFMRVINSPPPPSKGSSCSSCSSWSSCGGCGGGGCGGCGS